MPKRKQRPGEKSTGKDPREALEADREDDEGFAEVALSDDGIFYCHSFIPHSESWDSEVEGKESEVPTGKRNKFKGVFEEDDEDEDESAQSESSEVSEEGESDESADDSQKVFIISSRTLDRTAMSHFCVFSIESQIFASFCPDHLLM